MTQIILELPDALAEQAREWGLLSPVEIESLLRKELKRRAWQELKQMVRTLNTDPNKLSHEEIQEELAAHNRGE